MTTYFKDANGNPDAYTPPWERSERNGIQPENERKSR